MAELKPLGGKIDDCLYPGRWLVLKSLLDGVATMSVGAHPMGYNATVLWGIWPFYGTEQLHDLGGGLWSVSGLHGNTNYMIRAGQGTGNCSDVHFRTP